jgi:O-antigen/teichoic acid export membrane protein
MALNVRSLWRSLYCASSFGANVLLTTGTNILLILLGLTTGILAARLLGPQGRGELAAIQMWPSFLAGIAMLGLPEALAYYSAQSANRAGRYLGSAMALAALACLPFMGAGYIVMPFFLSAQSAEVVVGARWYLLLLPLTALMGIPYHALRGRGDFTIWNGLRLAPGLGWLALLSSAWLFGRAEPIFLALGYLMVQLLLSCPVIYLVTRRVSGPFWPEVGTWKPMLRYGLPCVMSIVPQMLNLRLDQMLMAGFLPVQTLGLYVIAISWSNAVNPLLNALGTVLFPRITSQSDVDQRARVFAQGCRLAVVASACIAMIVALFTPWFLPLLFGERFAASVPAALVLVMAAAVLGINGVLEEGLRGFGNPDAVLKAELGGLGVTLVALLLLLPPLGIMGAAVASVIGYGSVAMFLISQARRLTGQSPVDFLCPTRRELHLFWDQTWLLATPLIRWMQKSTTTPNDNA